MVAAACGGVALAWHDRGSIDARAFLPYAVLTAAVALVALAARRAAAPSPPALAGATALTGLAAWSLLSAVWAPLPSLARDESLLLLYGVTALLLATTTTRERDRTLAMWVVVAAVTVVAGATVATLLHASTANDVFRFARLSFPITYANACAAFFGIAVWPAVALAAGRAGSLAARACAGGAAGGLAATAVLAQSKGSAVGLAASVVAVAAVARPRRCLVFALPVAVPVTVWWGTLTRPFAETGAAQVAGMHRAAGAVAAVAVAAACGTAVLAAAGRRIHLAPRSRRHLTLAGRTISAVAAVALLTGAVVERDALSARASRDWRAFRTPPPKHTNASSHFLELGSNRSDFWRVALDEWRAHPIAGTGARGFAAAYLVHGRSDETPARAHSLPLEIASETGAIGLVFAVVGYGSLLVGLARRARGRDLVATGALGAAVLALGQALVDWTFTFPAVTIPFFLLAGVGLAGGTAVTLPARPRRLATLATAAALVLFLVPWLAARLVQAGSAARDTTDLRWAHRLDPLSIDPLVAEAAIAPDPAAAIAPLREARRIAPRSVAVRYFLGSALAAAGDRRAAVAELTAAERLDPRDPAVRVALQRARR
ncbi:MAG TPA: O-antigen ligase family protein [Gaiellaceae bacterium]